MELLDERTASKLCKLFTGSPLLLISPITKILKTYTFNLTNPKEPSPFGLVNLITLFLHGCLLYIAPASVDLPAIHLLICTYPYIIGFAF